MTDDPAGNTPPTFEVRRGNIPWASGLGQILPANPKRLVMLLTTPIPATSALLYLGSPDAAGFLFSINPGVYTEFSYRKHGDMVYLPLFMGTNGSGATVSYITLEKT